MFELEIFLLFPIKHVVFYKQHSESKWFIIRTGLENFILSLLTFFLVSECQPLQSDQLQSDDKF